MGRTPCFPPALDKFLRPYFGEGPAVPGLMVGFPLVVGDTTPAARGSNSRGDRQEDPCKKVENFGAEEVRNFLVGLFFAHHYTVIHHGVYCVEFI